MNPILLDMYSDSKHPKYLLKMFSSSTKGIGLFVRHNKTPEQLA